MAVVAMTGSDTITINNRLITGGADGNVVEITYPNEMSVIKTGKNGNSIIALNETGLQAEVVLRLIRGCSDDKYLNEQLNLYQNYFASFVLMNANFTKQIGDGLGVVTADVYIMSGGVFGKQVEGKSNVEGDTEQSVAIYNLKFSTARRAMT